MWKPIQIAPWGKEVLLTGSSGYISYSGTFVINGYRLREWHQGQWNDPTGTPLADNSWIPTHWDDMPTRAIKE